MARRWGDWRWRLAGLVLALLVGALLAGPARAQTTKRAGAHWAGLTRDQKTDLVLGIFDGFNLSESILSITLKNEYTICSDLMEAIMHQSDAYFSGMSAGRIVSGLDTFYLDKRNRNIPISWGVWVIVRQGRGDRTVAQFIQELRKLYP